MDSLSTPIHPLHPIGIPRKWFVPTLSFDGGIFLVACIGFVFWIAKLDSRTGQNESDIRREQIQNARRDETLQAVKENLTVLTALVNERKGSK